MSRGAWEVASGAKESGISALFKGASLISRKGETVSVLTALRNKTALFYFASKGVESCKHFNELLSKFYDTVRQTDDSIVVIFVSNDDSKEEQVEFFNLGGMHEEWLMVEWTHDLEDIADHFKVEKIPSLVVVSTEGKAVVQDARDQVWDTMAEQKQSADAGRLKAAVDAKWAEWRRLAGDWRASTGHTLGGAASSSSSASAATAAAMVASGQAGGGGRNDREALRAARLAALEKRMGGAAGADPSSCIGATGSASSSSAAPAAPALAAAAAAPPFVLSTAPRVATVHGGSGGASSGYVAAAGSSGYAGGSTGSGSFASGAAAAAAGVGTVGYTLAGGRVELPPAPQPTAPVDMSDDEVFSDMASDGAGSGGNPEDLPDAAFIEEQALSSITAMGFPLDAARRALQAANGDVDSAVALLLGE